MWSWGHARNDDLYSINPFKAHTIWNLPTTIQWQNLFISTDSFVSIFFPMWYKRNSRVSIAYICSSFNVINAFLFVYVPLGLGLIKGPPPSDEGSGCDFEYWQDEAGYWVFGIVMVFYSAIIPLLGNCALTVAVFVRRGLTSKFSRECFQTWLITW